LAECTTPRREVCSDGARNPAEPRALRKKPCSAEILMDAIIYLVGLVIVVMAILSFFGLR
jgi:hypothetical protein